MSFKIDGFEVGGSKAFIIAEIGNNHNGSLTLAKELVDDAVKSGADCAKFQMRNMNLLYRKESLARTGEDLGSEYILDLLEKFELSLDEHKELKQYCEEKNIIYLCTPWDEASVDALVGMDVAGFKVASADFTNVLLLEKLSLTGKPLILSTGMSSPNEVEKICDFLGNLNVTFALLHTNSTYPAPFSDINLNWLKSLRKFNDIVGYSGHERGINVSMAAVALGAKVVERHLTKDRLMEGPDHAASLTMNEFLMMVVGIREVEAALGTGDDREISQGEMINRENLGKSLVAATNLSAGHILSQKNFLARSPGSGISPILIDDFIGKELMLDIREEDFFTFAHIGANTIKPKTYKFDRDWGIPVRYHDFKKFRSLCRTPLLEFHLSYSDMELCPEDFLEIDENVQFVVHAPELFKNSHLMDLTSTDVAYRKESIKQTQRVIDITRNLKYFFPASKKPLIVANVGGFSMDDPLSNEEKLDRYNMLGDSLSFLDRSGVELIPQTMAPFPWHFGGQRFQNLFVFDHEIVEWAEKLNLRFCLDISHSALACAHFNKDLYDFVATVAPITAHIHVGDAKGVNGEGLQIGQGEICFDKLCRILQEKCPNATFIPEIWQGHKDNGSGFWTALNSLEGLL